MSHHHHHSSTNGHTIPVSGEDCSNVQENSEEISAADTVNAELADDAEEIRAEDAASAESASETADGVKEETAEENTEASDTSDAQDASASEEAPKADEEDDRPKEVDWKDAYVRLAADFDNFRKRTSREQDDIRRRERERVVGIWLEVYDNAERALASMKEKSGPWFEGFSSLIQQMDKCLSSLKIKAVDDIGQKFDPKRHEAIATVPNPEMENNTIMYIERKGFVYENGDVARVARVIVVKNPS